MAELTINPKHNVFKKYRQVNYINSYAFGSGLDLDAKAFIDAAVITNPTQISAINTLVVALKGYGLWTKFIAIYPLVGGTATTHKFNLKDPRDLDAAFRLVYVGGVSHSSNGMSGNGIDGYATTFINPFLVLTGGNNHMSNYCRSIDTGNYFDMGGGEGGNGYGLSNYFAGYVLSYNPQNSGGGGVYPLIGTNSSGFFIGTKTANNSHKIYKNGSLIYTDTTNVTVAIGSNIFHLLRVNGGSPYHSARQYSFFTIGLGLNDTESSNLYTAVQAYQTTLGR